jgi:hypothetical protein
MIMTIKMLFVSDAVLRIDPTCSAGVRLEISSIGDQVPGHIEVSGNRDFLRLVAERTSVQLEGFGRQFRSQVLNFIPENSMLILDSGPLFRALARKPLPI